MFTITPTGVKTVPATHRSMDRPRTAGEQANIIATGVVIHPGLVQRLPETYLTPLTSTGDTHTYSLTVRGYTVQMFIDIVTAFANGDFETGERLIREITPTPTRSGPPER